MSLVPSTLAGLLRAATKSSLALNCSHGNQGSPQAATLEGWDSILQSTCDPGEPIRLNWGTRLGVEVSLTAVLWDQAAATVAITGKVLGMQILLEAESWMIPISISSPRMLSKVRDTLPYWAAHPGTATTVSRSEAAPPL